jgi:hypothetical protein
MKCDDVCLDLAPTREMLALGRSEQYLDAYIDRLEVLGVKGVMAMLDTLSIKAQGKAVVLLCFESLSPENVAKGQWCHRQIFAEWCKFRGKIAIPEL